MSDCTTYNYFSGDQLLKLFHFSNDVSKNELMVALEKLDDHASILQMKIADGRAEMDLIGLDESVPIGRTGGIRGARPLLIALRNLRIIQITKGIGSSHYRISGMSGEEMRLTKRWVLPEPNDADGVSEVIEALRLNLDLTGEEIRFIHRMLSPECGMTQVEWRRMSDDNDLTALMLSTNEHGQSSIRFSKYRPGVTGAFKISREGDRWVWQ